MFLSCILQLMKWGVHITIQDKIGSEQIWDLKRFGANLKGWSFRFVQYCSLLADFELNFGSVADTNFLWIDSDLGGYFTLYCCVSYIWRWQPLGLLLLNWLGFGFERVVQHTWNFQFATGFLHKKLFLFFLGDALSCEGLVILYYNYLTVISFKQTKLG